MDDKLHDALISLCFSVLGVGILVGNAYVVNTYGYPGILDYVGVAVMFASFFVAIPPAIPLVLLGIVGVDLPLRGRETFVESNLWLWVYCAAFYACLIFWFLRYRRRVRLRSSSLEANQ